jgi:predicted nucleic acid-binding protein
LIVPAVTIYEVFKVVLRESNESQALQAVAAMQRGKVVELTAAIAMNAARLSMQHRLPMADSVILATARAHQCLVWTQDADFQDLEGVKYFPKAL